jgi:hypothetical protein
VIAEQVQSRIEQQDTDMLAPVIGYEFARKASHRLRSAENSWVGRAREGSTRKETVLIL